MIDKYIPVYKDSWNSGSYSMFSLKISLTDTNESENLPTIIHEYTHYLQNVTTFHGFTKIDDYIRLFLTIFAKIGSSPNDPELPLKDYQLLQKELGKYNLNNLIQTRMIGMYNTKGIYSFDSLDSDDYTIIEEKIRDVYHDKEKLLSYVIIDDQKIPLNEIVIRENMAMINTLISIKDHFSDKETLYSEILTYPYKEYSVIFDFINNYFPSKDVLMLTYRVCEIALNLIPIEESIKKILTFFQSNYESLKKKEEDNIIHELLIFLDYDNSVETLFANLQHVSRDRLKLFDRIIKTDNNEFVIILKKFYEFILKGLSLRRNNKTLFSNPISTNYLNSLTEIVGAPYIYYENSKQVRRIENTDIYFPNDFVFLHSALEVFLEAYYCNIEECPFFNTGICKEKKNDNCEKNCLDNYMIEPYDLCLLNNSLNCTGIRSIKRWEQKQLL